MTLTISQYVDPGVYVQEVIVPGALSIANVPVLPTIIARGARTRRAVNEAITRGLVAGEALSVAGVAPHIATLAGRGTRRLQHTTVYADGVALSDSFVSYNAASVVGTAAGTYDISSDVSFALEMDGNLPLTIILSYSAAPSAPAVAGAQVTVESTFSGTAGDGATRAEVAAAINSGLAAATNAALGVTSGGYGTAYAAVAADATTGISVTSPVSTPVSDVRLFASVTGSAGMTTLFGAASLDAPTVVEVSATVFDSGAAYTIDYVGVEDFVDAPAQSGLRTYLKVGAFPGVGTFREDTHFAVDGSYDLDWSNASATGVITNATVDSLNESTVFDLSTNDTIRIALDGRAAVDIDLNALASPPLGYANPSAPATTTAAEIEANINAVLGNNVAYGARYNGVASASGGVVTLTSPNDGTSSSITLSHPAALSAMTDVFGLSASQTSTVTGSGSRPVSASVYYASYSFPRPASDYNNPRQFFTMDQAFNFTGPIAADNPLAIAVDLAFKNGAPTILLIQVDDASSPGSPTRAEYQAALAAAATKSTATDIIILSTDLDVQIDLLDHIEAQTSPVEKNYRRGWFGMPRNTPIGDKDTANSLVYRATRTLQVVADSPGRGRMILAAGPGVEGISKTIALENGSTVKLNLDSSYIACAIASRLASLSSPADALARKSIAGFDIAEGDFTPWVRAERASLASQGVTVLTFDAGRYLLLDPITTEAGGAGLISFAQISASTQKDNIVRKVTQALDANIVGLVPTDLADFIIDIKLTIANVLSGEIGTGAIGPFRDVNNNTRAIDLQRDIVVEQDPNDPTKYFFKFFFNLRYPALRLFGEYSVDNPFFTPVA